MAEKWEDVQLQEHGGLYPDIPAYEIPHPCPPSYMTPPIPVPAPAVPFVVTVQPGAPRESYDRDTSQTPATNRGSQPNIPPGLKHLATLDNVIVKQKVELCETFTGCETNNRYKILDPQGQNVFYAKEDTDCCTRNFCCTCRPFDMRLTDVRSGQEIIHLHRSLACSTCCFPCCLQTIRVESPPGNLIGTVEQKWSICHPEFEVLDETGKALYFIRGPCLVCDCFCTVNFGIFHAEDRTQRVGEISKDWSGLAKEIFTDADDFRIDFPPKADAKMKATLLGACMLIDFMFFEGWEVKHVDAPRGLFCIGGALCLFSGICC